MNNPKLAYVLAVALMSIANVVSAQDTTAEAPTDAEPAVKLDETTSATESAANAQRPRQSPTDRIDLDTTVVTGNRELPKVLYIVPWKKAELGELPAQPFNTLLDEVLTPVDRDVFRREVTYYGAISNQDGAPNSAPPKSPAPAQAQ